MRVILTYAAGPIVLCRRICSRAIRVDARSAARCERGLAVGAAGALAFDLTLSLDQDLERYAVQDAPHGRRGQVPRVAYRAAQRVRIGSLGVVQRLLGRDER